MDRDPTRPKIIGSFKMPNPLERIRLELHRSKGPCPSLLTPSPVPARDSVVSLGGPTWTVQSGRRDSTTPSFSNANNDLPYLFMDLAALTSTFSDRGFTSKEMEALLGKKIQDR